MEKMPELYCIIFSQFIEGKQMVVGRQMDYPKCYFFLAHPMIFKNKKKMPILMTFKLVLECKS
jgi:hypothetical protein